MKDKRFRKIYDDSIPHSSFLSEESILLCMHETYKLGIEDLFEWLKDNDYLSDDLKPIKSEWFKHTIENKL